jgi:hypothetical protein
MLSLPPNISETFALLYILAQAVERIVEVFSDLDIFGDPISTDSKILHKRAITLWCLSSFIGIGVCLIFCADFFVAVNQNTDCLHPTLDKILSGIIVGSGTKPVHDIISKLEKYVKKPG